MRTALVTGAGGVVGRHLVAALRDRDVEVVALRREDGDIADPATLAGTLPGCDAVFHLAAQTIVGEANRSPLATWEANVRGTWLVLEACRTTPGVERVVVAGSAKAGQTVFPYEASKACAEVIVRSYAATYELPVATLRLGNVYGPGDGQPSRLVPSLVQALLAGEAPVIRSDGTPERDFLFASDAASAYLAVADHLPGVAGRAFDGGGDRPHPVREVVDAALRGSQVRARYAGDGAPPGETDREHVDSSELRGLGWRPEVGLEEGLRRTIEAARAHGT